MTDRELAEMIAQFRTPPWFDWKPLAQDIETVFRARATVAQDVEKARIANATTEIIDALFEVLSRPKRVADLAFLLREELGDSLSEGTPLNELKHAIITILRAAGFAAASASNASQNPQDL